MAPANPSKKPTLTPKALIHQKFGSKACYKVEEVQDTTQSGCPGLAISQKGPCLYQCTLELPGIYVTSGTFKRKKDAEQSAAKIAIEKLDITPKEYNPTPEEAWKDMTGRLSFLFTNEFLSSLHPLSGHIKAALRREGHYNGCIPVSAFAAYDPIFCKICKFIVDEADLNSQIMIPLILRAAAKLSDLVSIPDGQHSLKRRNPYPPEIISSITNELNLSESIPVEVVLIPASIGCAIKPLTLNLAVTGYYLDVFAHELGITEASNLLISRTIGKSSSEMRIFSSAPEQHLLDQLPELKFENNSRASYFAGQEVYGDAILASTGYTWRSSDLWQEAVSLGSYYRILVSMVPSGIYKISREAILAANLPSTFTAKGHWKGSLPRDILCSFCRFHHLSEPVFSTKSKWSVSSLDIPGSCKKLKVTMEEQCDSGLSTDLGNTDGSVEVFSCEVNLYSKKEELILQCSPPEWHRKLPDAIQSSALKVLTWLEQFFYQPNIPSEKLTVLGEKLGIHITPTPFNKEFALCCSMHTYMGTSSQASSVNGEGDEVVLIDLGGNNSGNTPSNGSLVSISYTVSLFVEDRHVKEHLESCKEFEFELGNEAALSHLESAVTQMSVGQSAYFITDLPPIEFIMAAASDSAVTLSLLSSRSCKVEYRITLLQVTEPLEERMEQALFSPPLSKQRVEFAVQHIRESSASSLVDFGCGSGSLLDSLLSYPTSLEKIVGVDISQRGLMKAAKLLHSKLNKLAESKNPSHKTKSAMLYDGSITNYDSRLLGFDIATCLEVIEHMDEADAHLFGNVALTSFRPKILIVSTPNYEYNTILQKSTNNDGDDKNEGQTCKFRNLDHKFEWTRAEFEQWASELAARHKYRVEFSGVGGAGNVEPGFASQIAIFRRGTDNNDADVRNENEGGGNCEEYVTIWEWNSEASKEGVVGD